MVVTPPPRRTGRALAMAGGVLVLMLVFFAGLMVGGHPRSTGVNELPSRVRSVLQDTSDDAVAREVMDLLRTGYYTRVDAAKLQRGSLDGMVAALNDRYSMYLDPAEYAAMQRHTEGIFFGVGMSVQSSGKVTTVTGVYPDSPAKRGGVRAGDGILAVNGTSMVGTPLDQVVAAVRGPQGTTVDIRFRRAGTPDRTVTLTRAKIKVPLVAARVREVNGVRVGYARLAEFDSGAAAELRAAVKGLQTRGVKALVFDLRGDPGGLVDEAVGVVGVFTRSGSPVVTTQGLHRDRETLKTNASPASLTLPVVLLVDRNSASASEIVAGALRDNGRARVVGTRTFGKALVQTTRELRNGGALRYTTARYVTPKGVDVSKRGLQPDIPAKDNPATTGVDEALQRALTVAAAAAG